MRVCSRDPVLGVVGRERQRRRCGSRAPAPRRVTPQRTSSSTSTVASAVEAFAGRHGPDAPPRPRRSGRRQCSLAVRRARRALQRRRVDAPAVRRAARRRPAAAGRRHVVGEQLHGRQAAGVAAARAARPRAPRPAAIPTLVSRALETTTGRPMSSAIRRQARTPPSGCTLSTATSAASQVTHPVGVLGPADRLVGGDRHVDPAADARPGPRRRAPAARRTPGRRRPARARGIRGDRLVDGPRAVDVDADPAVRAERVADRLEPGLRRRRGSGPARRP